MQLLRSGQQVAPEHRAPDNQHTKRASTSRPTRSVSRHALALAVGRTGREVADRGAAVLFGEKLYSGLANER